MWLLGFFECVFFLEFCYSKWLLWCFGIFLELLQYVVARVFWDFFRMLLQYVVARVF